MLRVVDVETTGMNDDDRVVELGWCDFDPVAPQVFHPDSVLINPGVPIGPEVSACHHIVDEDVAGAPALDTIWPFHADLGVEAYAAHNAKFEQKFLKGDFPWICTWKCALKVWPDAPSHKNGVLRYWLKLELRRSMAEPAHRAGPDAYVTAHILAALHSHMSVEEMIRISSEPALLPRVRFGKHEGKRWSEVPRDYLTWVLRQDFDEDVKFTARHHLSGGQTEGAYR